MMNINGLDRVATAMAKTPILLSGIQPSGQLTIGNYIGAIKHWVALQADHECYFPLVDLHTISVRQDPELLRSRCYDFLCLFIACGLKPENIFVQSHVPAHSQLAWVLNCYVYMGELNRMTQFKDKSKKHADNINAGLFTYPVLQAADILLYHANIVPVGSDQKQHLELTRDLAIRFNGIYGDIFTIPKPYIPPTIAGGRIMKLQNPEEKMSKSDVNKQNYVALLDPPNLIRKKLKRAVTDSERDIRFDASKPGVSNLLTLLSTISEKSTSDLEKDFAGQGYGDFKSAIGEALVSFLAPIQEHYQTIREDEVALSKILSEGAARASERATTTLHTVYDAIGLIKP